MASRSPLVGIVMGSPGDWEVMREAAKQLTDFSVPYEAKVLSAHRSPDALTEWVEQLSAKGARCFIAGAGGAAHLAGVIAAKTTLPVLGVPMPSKYLHGLDSLLSIVQMPKGVPVATFAIGEAGAANAGLFAVAMLAQGDAKLAKRLAQFRAGQAEARVDVQVAADVDGGHVAVRVGDARRSVDVADRDRVEAAGDRGAAAGVRAFHAPVVRGDDQIGRASCRERV